MKALVLYTGLGPLLVAFLGCSGLRIAEEASFRIYLLANGESAGARMNIPLDQLKLSGAPLFTEADIVAYDWLAHEIKLTSSAIGKIPRPGVLGEPFVAVADGERIYAGAFFTSMSSASFSSPVIVVDPILDGRPDPGKIRIDRAYPSDQFAKGMDPRNDPRIKACFERLGKLNCR